MKQGVSAGWKLNIHTFLRICFLYRLFLNFEAELDFMGTCIFESRTNRHLPQSVPIKFHVQNRHFGHS